jgi:hypothetical protein
MGTINLITQPTGGAPLSTNDYNYQNVDIGILINILDRKQLHLTEWDTLTVPALARYVYINHGGAIFQVQDSDYAITDPGVADGRIYIKVERSGDMLDAEFTDDATGYSWNFVYNGFYHADGSQLLPYVLYRDTADYWKFTLEGSVNKYDIEANIERNLTIDIGAWNMDLSPTVSIDIETHIHPDLLMGVSDVTIIRDDGNREYSITYCPAPGENPPTNVITNGIWEITPTDIVLYRTIGLNFDSANYDSLLMNRGYILARIRI